MKKLTHLLIATLLAFTFLAAPLTGPVKVAVAQTCTVNHSVASGETLSSIAVKYNVDWTTIATANNLKEPYAIFVGQSLCIPDSATSTTTTGTTTTTSTSKKPTMTFSIQGNRLYLETSNFTKKSSWYVKIGSGPYRVAELTKIGLHLVRKDTTTSSSFKVAKKYQDARYITLCLKNVRSDELRCSTILNPNAR
jgi:spore germination protein YaaH